ncbi:nitrilase-related carbon-nitrogen hydrolase [Nocardia sp. XZ_19_231]|uniref:nitrilase-related carbon-nitrogen hydrolase n=1 Tax=Nocardia sp. XZ_19_231 TaxID=2769252 RepID=UPI00188E9CAC|nr:nitrilase-related carbon-nitrogen hydrolase [Nocardia sp. XZ_19_231]
MSIRIRAAAVQAEPAWLHLSAGVAQTIGFIEDAGAGGAQLVAFPEVFLPGYPWWLWLNAVDWGSEFQSRYLANSMTRDGAELRAIADAAQWAGVWVVLGFAERAGDEVYMAQAMIGPDGQVRVARKQWPTPLEREIFADGVGPTVVYHTELGRVGVLGGADHLCPGRRVDLWREQVHVAAFSGFTVYHEVGDDLIAVNSAVAEQYARDNGVVVIAPTALVPITGWSVVDARSPQHLLLSGGGGVARILGPDGLDLVRPLPPGKSGLLFADLVVDGATNPWTDGQDYIRTG